MEKFLLSFGDVTDRVWDVKTVEKDEITFKSDDQFRAKACSFKIGATKYEDWKVEPVSYNDFGGDYKHVAKRNYEDNNP